MACEETRLGLACYRDHTFGYGLMRSVVALRADRMHATRAQFVNLYTPAAAGVAGPAG